MKSKAVVILDGFVGWKRVELYDTNIEDLGGAEMHSQLKQSTN